MNASTFDTMDASSSLGNDVRMRLDTYVRGECDVETLAPAMSAFCKTAPDAAWEVLAILDQYHRRGELPEDVFQSLKTTVNRIAFNVRETAPIRDDRIDEDEEDATLIRPTGRPTAAPVSKEPESEDDIDDAEPLDYRTLMRERAPTPFPVFAASKPPAGPAVDSSRLLSPGDVLRDRYVIEALLAFGQHAAVFKAHDRHRTHFAEAGRHVAIKVLNNPTADALAKFQNEFQLAQQLSHPYIVKVFDIDQDRSFHFFTMEFIEGQTLSQFTERAPLPKAQAARLVGQLGSALAYMHERNIVHGDIEPDNLLIGKNGELKLLDFGAASTLTYEPWISSAETQAIAKAAVYASCERLEGMPADKRDDIFSLACIAYELFADEHPFFRQFATRARDSKQKPQRIRSLSSRQWRSLSQGLAWSRNERPPSVRAWLSGMAIEPALAFASGTSLPGATRHANLLRAGLALAGLIVLIAVFTGWEFDPAKAPQWLTNAQTSMQNAAARTHNAWTALTKPASNSAPVQTPAPVAAAPPEPAPAATPNALIPQPAATESIAVAPVIAAPPMAAAEAVPPPDAAATPSQAPAAKQTVATGPARLGFARESFAVISTDSAARITIRRTGSLAERVSFVWWAESGTAEAGRDFVPLGRKTEYLEKGQREIVVFVPIVSSTQRRSGSVFFVEIGNPEKASLANVTRARVILSDE